jgi:gluconolactonase
MRAISAALALLATSTAAAADPAPAPLRAGDVRPAALIDLATAEGAALAGASWRAVLADVSGGELTPRPGTPAFDAAAWERIAPAALEERRGPGGLSFAWYRTELTIPARVGGFDTAGATALLEIVVDDYAEVWVDGKLPVALGQRGGSLIAGFNAPNRVLLTDDLRPGQRFEIAVLAANGPFSTNPTNKIWVRSAVVELHPRLTSGSAGKVLRLDPALDAIIPPDARIEKVASGFLFTEGPVWHRDGYLLFSDPNANHIYRWSPDGTTAVHRAKSGYRGADVGRYRQPGSNGLTFDREGRLTVAEHGNRRITRIEKNGAVTVLADRYQGKRLNSPSDLVYRSDGALYFTDPPFGLPDTYADPAKEQPHSGVYLWKDGRLTLVSTELQGPNGIAFSPDEKTLYVANWDEQRKVILRHDVRPDGTLGRGRLFFDMTAAPGEEALDGLKVDRQGNVYSSGPGGVWILSPGGKHLGTIQADELPANMAWGDADGKTLYLAARSGIYRLRTSVGGVRP